MGSPLDMALQKVMGLSDEAIRRRLKGVPGGAKPEDLTSSGPGDDATPSAHDKAVEVSEGEKPSEDGLSDADREKLRDLYARLTKGE